MLDVFEQTPKDLLKREGMSNTLKSYLPRDFTLISPTVAFSHPLLFHPEYGVIAIIIIETPLVHDDESNMWYSTDSAFPSIDFYGITERLQQEFFQKLNISANKLSFVFWCVNVASVMPPPNFCLDSDPSTVSAFLEKYMLSNFPKDNDTSFQDVIKKYYTKACAPKGPVPDKMSRFITLLKIAAHSLIKDSPVLLYETEITIDDLVDPIFLLPALMLSASEDWSIIHVPREGQIELKNSLKYMGFRIILASDPNALLGYRLIGVDPAHPYLVHGPVLSAIHRFVTDKGEYEFRDLALQFARWLARNHLNDSFASDRARVIAFTSIE